MAAAGPEDRELIASFDGLEAADALVLAVSGGPDSMALLHLAARWATALAEPPALHVATVDHGLRPASRDEAAFVVAAAAALNLSCVVLRWLGPKPATRIQERAREARYTLLADHARIVGATHVLTAHHADDQAETILLRLGRGSGLGGLAGMSREIELRPEVRLVRPFLTLPKEALVALCRRAGQRYVEDPSNVDQAYARSRLRAEAAALDRLGLDRTKLLRLAQRVARADKALEAEVDRVERTLAPARLPRHLRLDLAGARRIEAEIMLRLLRRAIVHVVGADRTIRLERLERLSLAIQAAVAAGRAHRATLGGARLVLGRDTMLDVTPEPVRRRGRPGAEGEAPSVPRLRPI